MNRRQWLALLASGDLRAQESPPLIHVPVHVILDARAHPKPDRLKRFSTAIWPETVRDFARAGVAFNVTEARGEIRRSPGGRPVFDGLRPECINVVLTDLIPLDWDNGRGLAGVSTRYEGFHICVIALRFARGHQIPYFSLNTCVHEILHVLLQDIYEKNPGGYRAFERELRIDRLATSLWLFGKNTEVRDAAAVYLQRRRANRPA